MHMPNPSNVKRSSNCSIWELSDEWKPEDFISKPKMETSHLKNYLKIIIIIIIIIIIVIIITIIIIIIIITLSRQVIRDGVVS